MNQTMHWVVGILMAVLMIIATVWGLSDWRPHTPPDHVLELQKKLGK